MLDLWQTHLAIVVEFGAEKYQVASRAEMNASRFDLKILRISQGDTKKPTASLMPCAPLKPTQNYLHANLKLSPL